MSTISPAIPVRELNLALAEFCAILTDEQRRDLSKFRSLPDADSILVFTAQLDATNRSRKGHSVGSRMSKVLQSTRDFCAIVNTFVSSNPQIAALVWRSVQLTMQAFYRSSEQEFQSDKDDIRRYSDRVKDAIHSAKAHIDEQERTLQVQERMAASENGTSFKAYIARSHRESDEARERRLRKEERKTQDRTRQLLEALCTYRPERLLKQNQRKRFRDTASCIFSTTEFHNWMDTKGPPLLWCSGKIGSGKTVVAASIVDHFLLGRTRSKHRIAYFFIHSSDRQSLDVETIMASVLRQALPEEATQLSDETEERLRYLIDDTNLNKLLEILQDVAPQPWPFYIVIDGVDECEKADRGKLLRALSSLLATTSNVKLFLASRESLEREIRVHFSAVEKVSMGHFDAQGDIATYIHGTLQEKIVQQDLVVGDKNLITEIERALNQRADGMFLWVFFQLQELCEQTCDEDIRETIDNLPEDLEGTFRRILHRISSRRYSKLAQKVLPWVAASARPLSLEELREAITIEIGQRYSEPERLCNDVNSIILACENLVHVDEEDQSVRFAHDSIKQFLVQEPVLTRSLMYDEIRAFYIDLEAADHFISEVCLTYTNFNDFKTALIRPPKPITLPSPANIALTTLGPRSKMASLLGRVLRPCKVPISIESESVMESRANDSGLESKVFSNSYPFLNYASTHWILHTKNFRGDRSKTWSRWKHIIIDGHDLVITPWQSTYWEFDRCIALKWAMQANHTALFSFIVSSGGFSWPKGKEPIYEALRDDNSTAIDIISRCQVLPEVASHVFSKAAAVGDLNVVGSLLAAGVYANATDDTGTTALSSAASGGHLFVVKKLLASGADINAPNADKSTALHSAAAGGHLDVVEWLLTAEADVSAITSKLNTALYLAASGGHLSVVKELVRAKGVVDRAGGDKGTALFYAAANGHLDVVTWLLEDGVDFSAAGGVHGAIRLAHEKGFTDVLEALTEALSGSGIDVKGYMW
ncbi:hypothetical protein O1611_g5843 [Lasiodiplodia mahajangana]|uniref:Uncharacterized protein n=1 Tax=Lasiodiplodia mahajangana TaxID=1108764 RepID=A0ACC2JK53_9PEZI|nr:hypothetical protein O1611_g5843 [Lasiodiplodia mahajangana]